jgi:hyperosmotically inducible periplasmic protein
MKHFTLAFGAVILAVSAMGQNPQSTPPGTSELPNETRPAPETQADPHSAAPEGSANSKSSNINRKLNAADRQLAAKIRRAVVADKGLSINAHNVKIIAKNGVVTLKGQVRSDDEAKSITAKAVDAAGSPDKVVNEMSVKP